MQLRRLKWQYFIDGNGGTETLGGAVTANGSGNVTLSATGATSDILFNANVSSTSGVIAATAGRNITLNGGNISTSGNVSLTGTAGAISEMSTNYINGALLTTVSATGTTLGNANTVTSFNGTNSGTGVISLVNTSAPLTITGISQTGTGAVSINNTGAISITGSYCSR